MSEQAQFKVTLRKGKHPFHRQETVVTCEGKDIKPTYVALTFDENEPTLILHIPLSDVEVDSLESVPHE